MKLEFHEAANIFPLDDEHLDALAEDIKKNGQQIAIEVMDGKILDGRRRTMACRMAGVEPVTREVKPDDPVAYVLSLNLHRRHLTPSQASMCAARASDIYERQAKDRQAEQAKRNQPQSQKVENLPPIETSKSRDAAGKAFGVSGKSVDHAKRVLEKGTPELVKAVDSGRMAVSTAAVVASEPPEEQQAAIEKQANRNYSKMANRGKTEEQEANPKYPGEHIKSELFAINKAEVAITQLKGIPVSNVHRNAALDRVSSWIDSQRKRK